MAARPDWLSAMRAKGEDVPRGTALRLALTYAAAATAWILFSDRLLGVLDLPREFERFVGSAKGVAFVAVTASLLYVLMSRMARRLFTFQERYRRLFENSTEGLVLHRLVSHEDGGWAGLIVEDVNPTEMARTGMRREDLIGRSASEWASLPDEIREHVRLATRAVEEGGAVRAETPCRDRWYLMTAYPLRRDLWATASADITEVRRAQERLRRQDEEIRQAYVDVLDAVTGGKLVLLTQEELRSELGRMVMPPREIAEASQLGQARGTIKDAASEVMRNAGERAELVSAAGEALNNALKHAGGGTFAVYVKDHAVQVEVVDSGPGIDFRTLPRATLVSGYSTTATLGVGFTIMLQLADRVLLATHPGRTNVVLEMTAAPIPAF